MTLNLHSHSRADLSRNHKVLDELFDLVVSTEVSTERAAFTTSSAAASRETPTNSVAANRSSGLTQSGAEFPCSGETNAQLDRDEQEGASQCSPSRSVSQSDPQIHLPVGQSEERNSVCELPEATPALSEPALPLRLSWS